MLLLAVVVSIAGTILVWDSAKDTSNIEAKSFNTQNNDILSAFTTGMVIVNVVEEVNNEAKQ